ncbi:MAG: NAD(P)/FAD-dependent oxidoreductase, partial [Anaerolineae bacterium]|nr:NAD(P)/FAD-dependent oxidoreductase [Anaerolineae bacterium]
MAAVEGMMKGNTLNQTPYDVAIIGGGPAGLQAALMLARTRRRVLVFDSPEPPRNAASHGVHNFVGLDGLLPAEIREQAWKQIAVYNSAELR